MEPKSTSILNFDERATKHVANLSSQPDDHHRGPMETVYTCAAAEQFEMDRMAYVPKHSIFLTTGSIGINL